VQGVAAVVAAGTSAGGALEGGLGPRVSGVGVPLGRRAGEGVPEPHSLRVQGAGVPGPPRGLPPVLDLLMHRSCSYAQRLSSRAGNGEHCFFFQPKTFFCIFQQKGNCEGSGTLK
jgi:hypothetical protein